MTETKLKIRIVAALVVIDAAWIVLRGFSFDATSLTMGVFVTIATAALGYFYRQYRARHASGHDSDRNIFPHRFFRRWRRRCSGT